MRPKVYLAGGFSGDWQNIIKSQLGANFVFFDPSEHKLSEDREYTGWDLYHISQSDILFGFMRQSNPSGYGLALEVGYAKALNKMIILVDEKSQGDETFQKYFKMAHCSASAIFSRLDLGIEFLKKFAMD